MLAEGSPAFVEAKTRLRSRDSWSRRAELERRHARQHALAAKRQRTMRRLGSMRETTGEPEPMSPRFGARLDAGTRAATTHPPRGNDNKPRDRVHRKEGRGVGAGVHRRAQSLARYATRRNSIHRASPNWPKPRDVLPTAVRAPVRIGRRPKVALPTAVLLAAHRGYRAFVPDPTTPGTAAASCQTARRARALG